MKIGSIHFLYFVKPKNLLKYGLSLCHTVAFLCLFILLKKSKVTEHPFLAVIKPTITYLVKYCTFIIYL